MPKKYDYEPLSILGVLMMPSLYCTIKSLGEIMAHFAEIFSRNFEIAVRHLIIITELSTFILSSDSPVQ